MLSELSYNLCVEKNRVGERTEAADQQTRVNHPVLEDADAPVRSSTAHLISEMKTFRLDCERRYKFNNSWDIVLNILGLFLSIAVVAAGFLKRPEISAVLGALVGAVLTAQKAFPFGQRSLFYRLLIGQISNLMTKTTLGFLTKEEAMALLGSLRMDFAQQLPRGSTSVSKESGAISGGIFSPSTIASTLHGSARPRSGRITEYKPVFVDKCEGIGTKSLQACALDVRIVRYTLHKSHPYRGSTKSRSA